MRLLLVAVAWENCAAWLGKLVAALRGLPRVPRLLRAEWDREPAGLPGVTVVVPARNEAVGVGACVESLLRQDYAGLRVIAVDDRSEDATGRILDELAGAAEGRLRVLHVTELPAGWLGKTHAMAWAAEQAGTEYVLFTDADVVFRPDAVRRALVLAAETGCDHLVVMPTTTIKRWDEAALLGFFQIMGLFAVPLWRVADGRSKKALGVGAFNLVRRESYERVGGFGALRMEIIEDVGLGRRMKGAGMRQQVALGRGLVSLHWAAGAAGIVGVMTKNTFAVFGYRVWLMLVGCGALLWLCLTPFAAVCWGPARVPGVLALGALAGLYGVMAPHSGLRTWNAVFAPVAAVTFVYAILRSGWTTLRQGGVVWRGTFYPLRELRRTARPLF